MKSLRWQETDVNSTIYHLTREAEELAGVHRAPAFARSLARLSDFTARNLISWKDSARSGKVEHMEGGN